MGATAVLILRTPPALLGARVLRSHGLARPSRISPPPGGPTQVALRPPQRGKLRLEPGRGRPSFSSSLQAAWESHPRSPRPPTRETAAAAF